MLAAAIVAAALAGAGAPASAGTSPFPLGVYAGNPNGNDAGAEASFEARLASFEALMGATPQTMNAFTDFTQPVADWPSNAGWTAWSWTRSPLVGHAITPVIGIPMSDNWHWYSGAPGTGSDWFFQQIVAGAFDASYQGVVDAWVHAGFPMLYLRLGYEMDGGFMPWYMGSDPATQADWVAAFQHLANLLHARGVQDGATVDIVWNPAELVWSSQPVASAYPGDAYVDVISLDVYSRLYPFTLYDWGLDDGTYDVTLQQWWSSQTNLDHYWRFPDSQPSSPQGTGAGWGFGDTAWFARQHGKPLAISECGGGGDGLNSGPVDFPAFPTWLASALTRAQDHGSQLAYVNIWDTWMSDGDWAFSMPGDGKPLEAAAWVAGFGAPPD